MKTNSQFSILNSQKEKGFTTASEAQYESQLSYSPSAGGAKARRAFTLIETMIAVAILSLAVAGPLTTASRAIVAAQTARDQLTASYLAQEGIEYVRALRDEAFLAAYHSGGASVSATAWNNFTTQIEPVCLSPLNCTLDPARNMGYGSGFAIEPYAGNSPLYLTNCTIVGSVFSCNPALTHLYTQQNLSGSVPTPFTRTIQVFNLSATDERIVSTVSWSFHGIPYSVATTDHLSPWQ